MKRTKAQQASDEKRAERREKDPDTYRTDVIADIQYSLQRMTIDELEQVQAYIGKSW